MKRIKIKTHIGRKLSVTLYASSESEAERLLVERVERRKQELEDAIRVILNRSDEADIGEEYLTAVHKRIRAQEHVDAMSQFLRDDNNFKA